MKLCAVVPVYRHVRTVGAVLDALSGLGIPCIVVDDGNSEDDARTLTNMAAERQQVEIVRLPRNSGKGGAIQAGLQAAGRDDYTHALQIDADGQHDAADIGRFVALAAAHPQDMICGVPVFDASVPRSRLYGRYLTHFWVWIHTLSLDIRDSMCGFRIYPLDSTLQLLRRQPLPARMDFDIEVLVRLHWRGLRFQWVPTRVIYPPGGLSHFHAWRDNARISWMHTRLFLGMLWRSPLLLWRKLAGNDRQGAHWASLGETTWTGGILFLLFVHRCFGRWPFRVAVFPVVSLNWLLRPGVRRASREYLQRIAIRTSAVDAPGLWSTLKHVMHFAETVLDKLLAAGGRYPLDRVRTEGREALYEATAGGRGAIIITAHMGCLEICQHMAESANLLRLNILMHTRHAEKFNRIIRRLNPHTTARFMEVTDAGPVMAMQLSERVAAGECVIIAGDRIPVQGSAVVPVQFLGQEANFPVGPYVLASLFECPLFFLGCIREGRGHVVHFDRLAQRVDLPRRERNARLALYAAEYSRCLEAMLRRSPFDWFNFFDLWKQGYDRTTRT